MCAMRTALVEISVTGCRALQQAKERARALWIGARADAGKAEI
jgi:hypothetical protein